MVLPSLATSEPPNDHMMARHEARESSWWASPMPTGKPLAFSLAPPTRRSSQESGPLGIPISLQRSLRYRPGKSMKKSGIEWNLPSAVLQ